MPTKYVIGLTSEGTHDQECMSEQICPCMCYASIAHNNLLLRVGFEQDEDAIDTEKHVFMTDKAGSKYDCRIPAALQPVQGSDHSKVRKFTLGCVP